MSVRRGLGLLTVVASMAACDGASDGTTSPIALEGRLIAPCCWTQTLDVHESPLATELRDEIKQRLSRGERAEAIEDNLVERYGERIRAVPKGRDPRKGAALVALALMLLAGVGLALLMRRWTRRGPDVARAPLPAGPPARDEYDERVDAELREMDDV